MSAQVPPAPPIVSTSWTGGVINMTWQVTTGAWLKLVVIAFYFLQAVDIE